MKQIPLAIGPEPSQTFENFLPGANAATLAHLLALAPGAPPVYLWGPDGSGKTHLLHALVGRAAAHGQQSAWYSAATAAPWSEVGERDWLVFDDAHAFDTAQQQAAFSLFVEATGRGTGVDDQTLAHKVDVVRRALDRHRPDPADPLGVLAAVGGLEHAALAGYLLGAAALRVPVVLDGVIACAAALAAAAFRADAVGCMIAGHQSTEPGAGRALAALGLRPVLDLGLRLGEGSGAVLALPVVQAAARVLRDVATFDSAGVSGAKQ